MQTERASPRHRGLDDWEPADVLQAILDGQFAALAAVHAAQPLIGSAVLATTERLSGGGRLVYIGAGTSGRLAVQDGVELTPTFGWPRDRLLFLVAGGEAALTRSIEGAEDDATAAESAVAAAGLGSGDVAVGLSASGTTPYTVAALRQAGADGALTVGVACNPQAPLLAAAEHPVLLATGSEVIAGSTRMQAGTAQRAFLTMFSSAVMVGLGHVHDGLMVDVQATNRKLVERSVRMLVAITGRDEEAARAALAACGGRVKPAALVLRGLTPEAAADALARSGGKLRAALAALD